MASRDGITKRTRADGSIVWRARWQEVQPDGRLDRASKTFDTREAAEDFLRLRRRGKATAPASLTVAEMVDDVLDRAADRLSAGTLHTYRQRARTMILPHLGDRRLLDLTTLDCQRWIDTLVRAGYKPATIHAAVAVLFSTLQEATTLGLLDRNVAQGIRRPRNRRQPMTVWTPAQARQFLATVKDDPIYGPAWHTALATGMRPGELRALEWRDVDFDRLTIHVRRTIARDADGHEVVSEGTKRGAGRRVAITAPLAAMLRRHKVAQTERRLAHGAAWWDHGVVFDRGNGLRLNIDRWRVVQREACAEAGVPYLTAHQLRHVAATLLLEAGTPVQIVAAMLGHSTPVTTMSIYQHVDADMNIRAASDLSALLFDEAASDE